jgi:sensor histidine kinase YesM
LRWRIESEPAVRERLLPPMLLQTLVENAVKHGIGPKPEGGTIEVRARRVGGTLEVVVTDTGVGFSDTLGTGIGLANMRARLRIQYGPQGSLFLQSNKPSGVRAMIRIPCTGRVAAS